MRIGVPAVTTRGMKEEHMETVVAMIDKVLKNIDDKAVISSIQSEVKEFMQQFPLYPELG
jgi:glycine hydroxymethyltransferase